MFNKSNPHLKPLTLLAILCLCVTQGCKASRGLRRADALRTVTAPAVDGWKEALSDKARFRVLFPSSPKYRSENDERLGFSLAESYTTWTASYQYFQVARTTEQTSLRQAYRDSVEAMIKNRGQLLSQRDVRLNGRLGTECVVVTSGVVTYLRSFLYINHMYFLEVDRRGEVVTEVKVPKDVQQFFDSFTFWDVN